MNFTYNFTCIISQACFLWPSGRASSVNLVDGRRAETASPGDRPLARTSATFRSDRGRPPRREGARQDGGADAAMRIVRGIEVTDQTLSVDVIAGVALDPVITSATRRPWH